MKRQVWACIVLFALSSCEKEYAGFAASGPLVIYGTTDTVAFRPVLDDFRQLHPNITIEYDELEAGPLVARFLAEDRSRRPRADLLLSSAMDLQVKLVNDGYAAPHISEQAAHLPAWARWRDEAFGFTFEPVVMVYNRELMKGRTMPQTRAALLADLRLNRPFWQGRIGAYDVAESSVGYFIASQDFRYSSDFGALIEAFRGAGIEQRSTTAALLDDITSGKLALGYNLLGSYAEARARTTPVLQVVYPIDYTLAVSRTAVLPKSAPHAQSAHVFLEYLLSPRGQQVLTDRNDLNAVRSQGRPVAKEQLGPIRPIPLGPGLLVYLDRQKRARMLELFGVADPPETVIAAPTAKRSAFHRAMTD